MSGRRQAPVGEKGVGGNEEGAGPLAPECFEGRSTRSPPHIRNVNGPKSGG
jgi:hypothetical protein